VILRFEPDARRAVVDARSTRQPRHGNYGRYLQRSTAISKGNQSTPDGSPNMLL